MDPKSKSETSPGSPTKGEVPVKSLDQMIAEAVGKAMEAALPMAMLAVAKASIQRTTQTTVSQQQRETCPACRQYITVCSGKHREVVVLPKDSRFQRWFPGIGLNGVWYRSAHRGQKVTIPEGLDAEAFVNNYEESEATLLLGRVEEQTVGVLSGKVQ